MTDKFAQSSSAFLYSLTSIKEGLDLAVAMVVYMFTRSIAVRVNMATIHFVVSMHVCMRDCVVRVDVSVCQLLELSVLYQTKHVKQMALDLILLVKTGV